MKINEIYTAFITWQNGGKYHSILIVETEDEDFSFTRLAG